MARRRGQVPSTPLGAERPGRAVMAPRLTDYLDARELVLAPSARNTLAYDRWQVAYRHWRDGQLSAGRIIGMDGDRVLWGWDRAASIGNVRPT
ncbi:hypothetical protein [Aeromicrobium wangtongii]|uniref:Uncharacterized protein n=1 Tax=Aeromicrobium wangtongii TaxID=2969247 RepID=A0ABY5ME04_9ACTN|nr:hypothetical protein [Aeromicrobium wangtongii]MCD9197475.1 hypothetical protein [Aeromicrobium wangtongii]UUP14967.1 hypothetical protein NQV15_06560 [Aeromicrobium wangtongii]